MTIEQDDLRKSMLEKLTPPPAPAVPAVIAPPVVDQSKENFDSDYEYTRKKLKNLADKGEEAIEHFAEVAKETNEPRAFEVLATLLKNTSDIVKGVIDNASAKSEIDKKSEPVKIVGDKDSPTVNNTTIFVGTTRDLLQQINKEQQKTIDAEATEIK